MGRGKGVADVTLRFQNTQYGSGRQLKKILAKQFEIVLWSGTLVAMFFLAAALIWSPIAALKLKAVKTTLISKYCSHQKFWRI